MELVLPLRDLGRADLAVAGGKGANLGELLRGGFAVPDGFVITTAAYAEAVRGIPLPSVSTDAAITRDALSSASIPDGLRDGILAEYRRLGAGAVAVRSSATAEDLPGAAFAGQQETFLNVRGDDELLDAVRRCWASLWADRAIAYRAQRQIVDDVQIAVVVQVLVPADIAGVMFTADPVTGERDRTVIDASPGLGEAVVSGLVTPDHTELDSRDRVTLHRAGRGEVVIRPDERGGTRADAGTADARLTDIRLTSEQQVQLAVAGRSIEGHFGVPQDVEWAFAADRLWILQARPLTALPPAPRRVNPLRRMMGSIVAELLPIRPYPLDMSTWTLRGHGRILTRMVAELPGLRLNLNRMLPETEGVVDELVPPEPHPTASTLTAPMRVIRQARRFDTRDWLSDPRFAIFDREVTELRSLDPRALAWPDLIGVADRVLTSLDGLITLRVDYLPHAGVSLLKLRVRLAVLGLLREAGPLSRGIRTRTADANEGLAGLAGLVASRPELLAAFRACGADDFERRVRADEVFAELREPVAAYLAEYGHREVRSAFLMSEPTWGEVPALLYDGIGAFIDNPGRAADTGDQISAAAAERVRGRRRVRITRSADAILAAAEAARAGIAFREDTHFHAPRGLPALRGAMLEAGRRLAEAGVIDEPRDVFHLRLSELAAITDPLSAGAATRTTVLARKKRRASFAGAPLISPATLYPHRDRGRDSLVAGTPAGGGRASGRVRIVLEPARIRIASLRRGARLPVHEPVLDAAVRTGGRSRRRYRWSRIPRSDRRAGVRHPGGHGHRHGHSRPPRRRHGHGRWRCRDRAGRDRPGDDGRSPPGPSAPRRRTRVGDPRRHAGRARPGGICRRQHGCRGRACAGEQGVAVPPLAGQSGPDRGCRLPDASRRRRCPRHRQPPR